MLELTESTIAAFKELAVSSRTAGVRIFAEPESENEVTLSAALVEWPAEDDEVVEEEGARVYLDREAALVLDHKVLDTYVEDGTIHLALLEQ